MILKSTFFKIGNQDSYIEIAPRSLGVCVQIIILMQNSSFLMQKFIIFNAKFIIFNAKFISLNANRYPTSSSLRDRVPSASVSKLSKMAIMSSDSSSPCRRAISWICVRNLPTNLCASVRPCCRLYANRHFEYEIHHFYYKFIIFNKSRYHLPVLIRVLAVRHRQLAARPGPDQ